MRNRFLLAMCPLAMLLSVGCTPPEVDAGNRQEAMNLCLIRLDKEIKEVLPVKEYAFLRSDKAHDRIIIDSYCEQAQDAKHKGYWIAAGVVEYLGLSTELSAGQVGDFGKNKLDRAFMTVGVRWKDEENLLADMIGSRERRGTRPCKLGRTTGTPQTSPYYSATLTCVLK